MARNIEGLKLGQGWNRGTKGLMKKNRTSFKKGDKAHLGYKHSEESKKLISKNRKGIKHSEETKLKMKGRKVWNKGIKMNEETKMKVSKSKMGSTPWNKGLKGFRTGVLNNNWKGGITPTYMKIRHCFEYKELMKLIKERDNFTCQSCGKRGEKLHVDHHPVSFAQIVKTNDIKSLEEALECELMWDQKNLRTLCVLCHKLTDTYLVPLSKQKGNHIYG